MWEEGLATIFTGSLREGLYTRPKSGRNGEMEDAEIIMEGQRELYKEGKM